MLVDSYLFLSSTATIAALNFSDTAHLLQNFLFTYARSSLIEDADERDGAGTWKSFNLFLSFLGFSAEVLCRTFFSSYCQGHRARLHLLAAKKIVYISTPYTVHHRSQARVRVVGQWLEC